MRGLLTTQSQNGYREQIKKEMLTRLAWKSRYADLYPSCCDDPAPQGRPRDPTPTPPLQQRSAEPRSVTPEKKLHPLPPPEMAVGEGPTEAPPLMRPVSPKTKQSLYQDSSHHGKGRRMYLQRRGHVKPEEKFDFPVLSSWEYGWRLGDYTLDYKTPSSAKSSVVRNTFYAKNGVFGGTNDMA
ncbi:unnamed protein product [Ophioblennius macclurei]